MRKLFLILLICPFFAFTQTNEQSQQIEEFLKKIKIENQNLVFSKIIDSIPHLKNDIYSKIISNIAITYKSANDVIQQQDKDAGIVIVRGNFEIFSNPYSTLHCPHILKIDIKDNKIRITYTIDKYLFFNKKYSNSEYYIINEYPFTQGIQKKMFADYFISLCKMVNNSMNNIEELIKSQNKTTNDDW